MIFLGESVYLVPHRAFANNSKNASRSSLGTQCSFCHIHQHILQEKFQTGCVGPCEPDLTVDIQQDSIVVRKPNATSPLFITLTVI
jgi:hypothetical protein